ncbi:MAG: enolase C-terminal domain-like protein [SAR202 cluster bacterium]|jgi:L-alanine-DL-glutamate epimerase-like enolase superfamily enzyme|nr:enolase C-terminal domain-like protein [SAR202 cluster bacterium]MDP6513726.1 enolase C-terminal domain-like protein [SAR202 cluster bacterium]MDP6715304.1 enolase C-terminal domain-like protein [SAR202 cluster bacterium]
MRKMPGQRIVELSVTPVPVQYRKELGTNSRNDPTAQTRTEWLVRARTEYGQEGLTIANRFMREFDSFDSSAGTVRGLVALLRDSFLNHRVDEYLETSDGRVVGVHEEYKQLFWEHGWMSILAFDLLGQDLGISAVDLLGGQVRDRVPAYDTTLYFQDMVHPENGAAQVASEAAKAHSDGYNEFKIKVGRPGRWMAPQAGMERDVEVVLGVREAVGPDAKIMVDANFGYDHRLDLLEDFMRETLPANIFWFEEMVTADVGDYRVMRRIRDRLGSDALLVCGEVDRDPPSQVFRDLVDQRLIDGYQPDSVSAGFSRWQALEEWLEPTGVRSIPHNFGNGNFGTRATLVFGAASPTFLTLEDERHYPNVYADDDVSFSDGAYSVPSGPGLGLKIDTDAYQSKYAGHEALITL